MLLIKMELSLITTIAECFLYANAASLGRSVLTKKIYLASYEFLQVSFSLLKRSVSILVSNEMIAYLIIELALSTDVKSVETSKILAFDSFTSRVDVRGWCDPFIILIIYYLMGCLQEFC